MLFLLGGFRRRTGDRRSLIFLFRGGRLFWRLHGCQNIRLIAKIFRSHFFDVVEGHGVHVGFESCIVIESQALKLVERAVITESVVALIGDFLLADQFLFGAL
jgi:hypothetical protein